MKLPDLPENAGKKVLMIAVIIAVCFAAYLCYNFYF
jgi:hypothetical protein